MGTEYIVGPIPRNTAVVVALQKMLSVPVFPGELIECTDTYALIMPELRAFSSLGPGGTISLYMLLNQLATVIDLRSNSVRET